MDKNLFLAVILSMAVYIGWYTFVEKRLAPQTPQTAATTGGAQAPKPGAVWKEPTAAAGTPASPASTELPAAKTHAPAGATVSMKLPQADATIESYGAAISSYKFHGPLGPIELVPDPSEGTLSTWPELAFSRVKGDEADSTSSAWEAKHPAGFTIRKTIQFSAPGKMSHILITLSNPGSGTVQVPAWGLTIGPGIDTVESDMKDNPKMQRAIGLFPPAEGKTKDELRVFKPGEQQGSAKWLAIDNRYFLNAAAAPAGLFDSFQVKDLTVNSLRAPALHMTAKPQALPPHGQASYDIPFYIGPKDYHEIESIGIGLERSVYFGWFDSLGRFILHVLEFLHKVTGNYGWSIILLTLLIQVLVFPLTYKSLKATFGMKKIQPEIAKLQQKYKEDPQRLNTEMMELYKAKGVNPMGGCLPMIIQMPIFVALYDTLRSAWELHGAPWMFWVKDLSAHDPYYILPLTMGGIMFVQNKINPAVAADPTQAQMMMFMPVIFTFMFLKFPAGLVLYWMTNSLMGAVQQLVLRKRLS